MTGHTHSCCEHDKHPAPKPWYRNSLVWILLVTFSLLAASFIFPVLDSFRDRFVDYVRVMGAPIAFGFVAGGLMDHFVPESYISKFFARRDRKTVVCAAGLGLLMSACSHGILALSMEFHKKGASGPAVVSFLLASPWANIAITFLLIGLFGLKGLALIFAALVVAIVTGLMLQVLDEKGWIERNKHSVQVGADFSIRQDIARRFRSYRFGFGQLKMDLRGIAKGMSELIDMVFGWVLIGMVLASLASAYVPTPIFEHYLGPSPLGLVMTLALATVLEVCSEGTSPLAFEIYQKTGAFGNAFAFLMGGVVTDYTEIGLVWKNLGRRTALWMLLLSLPQVWILASLFNLVSSNVP